MDRVAEIICGIGQLPLLRPDEDFYDAGFSSLGSLELLLELEATFGVAIPDDEFVRARSVAALHALITRVTDGGSACG